jgi:hypothetical protein
MMRWVGHATHMRGMRNVYNILVGKPDRKRLLGRPEMGGKYCCDKLVLMLVESS